MPTPNEPQCVAELYDGYLHAKPSSTFDRTYSEEPVPKPAQAVAQKDIPMTLSQTLCTHFGIFCVCGAILVRHQGTACNSLRDCPSHAGTDTIWYHSRSEGRNKLFVKNNAQELLAAMILFDGSIRRTSPVHMVQKYPIIYKVSYIPGGKTGGISEATVVRWR